MGINKFYLLEVSYMLYVIIKEDGKFGLVMSIWVIGNYFSEGLCRFDIVKNLIKK